MESKVNVLHGCFTFHTEYVVPTLLSASKPKQTCFITVAPELSCAVRCFHLTISIPALPNRGLALYQNVPNPKERSTEISFRITEPGSIATNQGIKPVHLGNYLYRHESNGQEHVKKMLID